MELKVGNTRTYTYSSTVCRECGAKIDGNGLCSLNCKYDGELASRERPTFVVEFKVTESVIKITDIAGDME